MAAGGGRGRGVVGSWALFERGRRGRSLLRSELMMCGVLCTLETDLLFAGL